MLSEEIIAKSILTKSKLPDTDYVLNPYVGCRFGCLYCYASFMGRFVDEKIENWGKYLYVKKNAVELFEQEYPRLKKSGKTPSIFLSSVTDPYQGAEKKYRLTRGMLEILAKDPYQGVVSILTKSPLVVRDLDVISKIPHSEVGLTITTDDDKLSRFLEVNAPTASRRFETLKQLNQANIKTYAFIGPLLPHFILEQDHLERLIASIAETGVTSVYVEHINLKQYIKSRMTDQLKKCSNEVKSIYNSAKFDEHREKIARIIYPMLSRYGLELRLNQVIHHTQVTKKC